MKAQNNRNREIANIAYSYAVNHPDESLKEAFEIAEVVYELYAGNAAPAQVETAREAKPARKSRTREEALTERYGDAEHRKAAVAGMKDCYEQSWSNWVEFRQTLEGLKRSEVKAMNQTVSGLARKAGYAGEVLDGSFFQKLVNSVR